MICPECGNKTVEVEIVPDIFEPTGQINSCPKCGWTDMW